MNIKRVSLQAIDDGPINVVQADGQRVYRAVFQPWDDGFSRQEIEEISRKFIKEKGDRMGDNYAVAIKYPNVNSGSYGDLSDETAYRQATIASGKYLMGRWSTKDEDPDLYDIRYAQAYEFINMTDPDYPEFTIYYLQKSNHNKKTGFKYNHKNYRPKQMTMNDFR